MQPIASATAYGALATKNLVLAEASGIATTVGFTAILVQEYIRPDMVQAIDQMNIFVFEVIAPKQIRPFSGYIYDIATDAAR